MIAIEISNSVKFIISFDLKQSPQTRLISQCDKASNNTLKRSQNPPNNTRSELELL